MRQPSESSSTPNNSTGSAPRTPKSFDKLTKQPVEAARKESSIPNPAIPSLGRRNDFAAKFCRIKNSTYFCDAEPTLKRHKIRYISLRYIIMALSLFRSGNAGTSVLQNLGGNASFYSYIINF